MCGVLSSYIHKAIIIKSVVSQAIFFHAHIKIVFKLCAVDSCLFEEGCICFCVSYKLLA